MAQRFTTSEARCPLISSENVEYKGKQRISAQNVKGIVVTFLFFDVFCLVSFGYLAATEGKSQQVIQAQPFFDDPQLANLNRSLEMVVFPSVLVGTFTMDVILALYFWWKLDEADPCWEDYRALVKYTWWSNSCTLFFLILQRITVVLSQRSWWVGVFAVVYVIIRCLKVRPLYKLKELVMGIDASQDSSAKYEEFWNYWSHESDASVRKRLLRCTCIFAAASFTVIMFLFVYMASNSTPMGVPQPRRHIAQQTVPIMLSTTCANYDMCDECKCRVKKQWYVCTAPGTCPDNTVAVTMDFDPYYASKVVIGTAGGGGAAGCGIAMMLGPELCPIGAFIGGGIGTAGGAGIVYYNVYVDYECELVSHIPSIARHELWCAQR